MFYKAYTPIVQKAAVTDPEHLTTKDYVDKAISKHVKDTVTAVSVENLAGTYSGGVLALSDVGEITVDNVVLGAGSRVLLAGQTDKKENGIYTVTSAGSVGTAGELTRAEDFDASDKIFPNCIIPIAQGKEYGDTTWYLTNDDPVTLDTTELRFATYKAPKGVSTHTETVTGDGTATEFTVVHSLGTRNISVTVRDSDGNMCLFGVKPTDDDSVTLSAAKAPASGETFTVTVMG